MNATSTMKREQPLIIRLLLQQGLLDPSQLDLLRTAQAKNSGPIEEVLVTTALANDHQIAAAYAKHLYLPLFDAARLAVGINPNLAELLPEKLCRDLLAVPVAADDRTVDVAFATPNELLTVDEIQLLTGRTVRPMIAALSVVEAVIGSLFEGSDWSSPELRNSAGRFEQIEERLEDDGDDESDSGLVHLDQPTPPGRDGRVIRLVNQILEQALHLGASDIHLEPFESSCKARVRIDGKLNDLTPPHRSLFVPIVSRFKVLAKIDIAEKRIPQDGAIALKSGDRRVDLRVSTVPTIHGEKVVLRILDKSTIPCELGTLGLDERQTRDLTESLHTPHGLMLVTGPTGSGKSTTLYSCLNLLNQADTNICTVEDPVEYKFDGMNQVQVKSGVGLTFASALRSFLRQDPDVIMVGEVRDQETAQICMRAALTGHFVLSTLHTNDALAAVTRLQDMGVEPFLLGSTLRVLEAQRLLRRLCTDCRVPYDCDSESARRFGFEVGSALYRPAGCDQCRGTGYRGRVGVFEVIRITGPMAGLVQSGAPLAKLRQCAREQGMTFLYDSALEKVRAGVTSLETALSVAVEGDEAGG